MASCKVRGGFIMGNYTPDGRVCQVYNHRIMGHEDIETTLNYLHHAKQGQPRDYVSA